jgi:tRNA-dihydrouridine synthase
MCAGSIEHILGEVGAKGERQGSFTVRKHLAKCFKGYPGAAQLRRRLFAVEESAAMIAILEEAAHRGVPTVVSEESP